MNWGDKDVQEFVKEICDNYEGAREDDVYTMMLHEYDAQGGKTNSYARGATFAAIKSWLEFEYKKPIHASEIASYRRACVYFRLLKRKGG